MKLQEEEKKKIGQVLDEFKGKVEEQLGLPSNSIKKIDWLLIASQVAKFIITNYFINRKR